MSYSKSVSGVVFEKRTHVKSAELFLMAAVEVSWDGLGLRGVVTLTKGSHFSQSKYESLLNAQLGACTKWTPAGPLCLINWSKENLKIAKVAVCPHKRRSYCAIGALLLQV